MATSGVEVDDATDFVSEEDDFGRNVASFSDASLSTTIFFLISDLSDRAVGCCTSVMVAVEADMTRTGSARVDVKAMMMEGSGGEVVVNACGG